MRKQFTVLAILTVVALGVAACGASEPEEAPQIREAPPEAPPAPTFELTEVAITEEVPDFTSANVRLLGIALGDVTADLVENLGEQSGETQSEPQDWVQAFHEGALTVYTLKITGEARQFVITTPLADQITDPNLQAWLEDGDEETLRSWMGPEDEIIEDRLSNNAVEYVYEDRGLTFINYFLEGQAYNAIRITQL